MAGAEGCRLLVAALAALAVHAAPAAAFGPVGTDPPANLPAGEMPRACGTQPRSLPCVNAAVYYLDRARASLGQPPYALPADFPALAPEQQALVLANLDRGLYGLPPVPGLTPALDQDAAAGVYADADPSPSDLGVDAWTSNWAGPFSNMPEAYEAWMFDDGPGSANVDCPAPGAGGCWGHRHDVLSSFDDDTLAMGASASLDARGQAGYAMLVVGGPAASYQPAYDYTWEQAVADGAGTNAYDPGLPQIPVAVRITVQGSGRVTDDSGQRCSSTCTLEETQAVAATFTARPASRATFRGWGGACAGSASCVVTPQGSATQIAASFSRQPRATRRLSIASVRVSGHTISVRIIVPPGAHPQCSLTRRPSSGRAASAYDRCFATTIYRHVPSGRYALRVRTRERTVTRAVHVP